jgi:hypothetical protein
MLADGGEGERRGWLGFLNAYRTKCLATHREFRRMLGEMERLETVWWRCRLFSTNGGIAAISERRRN